MAKTRRKSSSPRAYWMGLVNGILENTHCKHYKKLKNVLKIASRFYCKGDKDITLPTPEEIDRSEHSEWIKLVNHILINSECKYHSNLKKVLKEASKIYCKKEDQEENKKGTKTKRVNKRGTSSNWIEFVKKVQRDYKLSSYGEAMEKASELRKKEHSS